jgi:DNA-binding XRE family transcriptional regulator
MKTAKQLHKNWIKDPEYNKAYDAIEDEFILASELIAARTKAKLTQNQLAQKMKTSQSAIARLESGESNPSISLLKRYAEAKGTQLKVELLA